MVALPSFVIVIGLNPVEVMSSVTGPAGTFRVNSPLLFVTAPLLVPAIVTLAPGIGAFVSSVTTPFICRFCAKVVVLPHAANNRKKIHFFIQRDRKSVV